MIESVRLGFVLALATAAASADDFTFAELRDITCDVAQEAPEAPAVVREHFTAVVLWSGTAAQACSWLSNPANVDFLQAKSDACRSDPNGPGAGNTGTRCETENAPCNDNTGHCVTTEFTMHPNPTIYTKCECADGAAPPGGGAASWALIAVLLLCCGGVFARRAGVHQ